MKKLVFVFCFTLLAIAPTPKNAHAARPRTPHGVTFTVNSVLDEPDKKPGDGKCESSPSNKCTLRAAIIETNALGGSNTVVLPVNGAPYRLTRAGMNEDNAATGDLDIKSKLTLKGGGWAGTTIEANELDRAFHIFNKAKISGVTIQGGNLVSNLTNGGGMLIASGASLKIIKSVIRDNIAFQGGAIENNGTLSIALTAIGPGNLALNGGGIHNGGTFTLSDSRVTGNGIGNTAGNFAAGKGGGVMNEGALVVQRSTFDNNYIGKGGGLYNAAGKTVSIINSTFYSNRVIADGGGIYNDGGTVTLTHTTIAQNSGGGGGTGGGIFTNGGTVILKNSILDLNVTGTIITQSDCEGSVSTYGYNLIYSLNGCNLILDSTDKFGTHAGLMALADNGGPTKTAALPAASIAVDAIPNQFCVDTQNNPISIDQRGKPRPADGNNDGIKKCDMGAFELQP